MPASASTSLPNRDHAELDVVGLRSMLYTDAGVIPVGSHGTIVYRHDHGAAFEVEFVEPFPTVVTLRSADLTSV